MSIKLKRLYITTSISLLFISLTLNAQSQWQQKGNGIKGNAFSDESGEVVIMPNPFTIAVSAPRHNTIKDNTKVIKWNTGVIDAGQVCVYKWNGINWVQKGNSIDGENAHDQSGESLSMPNGNTLAIGSPQHKINGKLIGQVRVYQWECNKWVQKGNDLNGETPGDWFGESICMPNNYTLAIGTPCFDNQGKGFVRVYSWEGTKWVKKGMDIRANMGTYKFGYKIKMPNAFTVAICAVKNEGKVYTDEIYIYRWINNQWVQSGAAIIGRRSNIAKPNSEFNLTIAMPDPNVIAVASVNQVNNDTGQVRIYYWNGHHWLQKGKTIKAKVSDDGFGFSISMANENIIAIGAPNAKIQNKNLPSDLVRIYEWDGNKWNQKGNDIISGYGKNMSAKANFLLHISVSMPDENTIAIGNSRYDGIGKDSGITRIYYWKK